jgi:hypothetical protein
VDWRQQRKNDLEERMLNLVQLLSKYENKSIEESDPKETQRLKSEIASLKQQMSECQCDLDSLTTEKGTHKNLAEVMSNVTNDEIHFAITALLNQDKDAMNGKENFQPTNPKQKMSKNDLTHKIKFLLDMGLAKAEEVRHFIENIAKINYPNLAASLKASLNTEYSRQINLGVRGDELFMHLYAYSSNNSVDPSKQAAGLAVLCYFFETCDVFEP